MPCGVSNVPILFCCSKIHTPKCSSAWAGHSWADGICRVLLTCNPKPLSTCLSILAALGRKENPLFALPLVVVGLEWEGSWKGEFGVPCVVFGVSVSVAPPLLLAGADSCPEQLLWPLCPFSTSFFQGKTHKTQNSFFPAPLMSWLPWLSPQNTLLDFGGNALGAPPSFQGVSQPLSLSLLLPGIPLLGFFFWILLLSLISLLFLSRPLPPSVFLSPCSPFQSFFPLWRFSLFPFHLFFFLFQLGENLYKHF